MIIWWVELSYLFEDLRGTHAATCDRVVLVSVPRTLFLVRKNSFLMKFGSSIRCITFSRQMHGIYNQNFLWDLKISWEPGSLVPRDSPTLHMSVPNLFRGIMNNDQPGMYILQVGLFFSQTESNQGPSFSPFTSSFCVLCAHSDTFYVLKLAHSNWKHKQSLKTLNQCLKKLLNAKIRNFFTYLGPIFFPPPEAYPLN